MSDIKLKVCGLRDNAQEVIAQIEPDYAGFIFYNKSPRFVNELDVEVSSNTKKVGVFVNEDYDYILEKVTAYQLDVVQLHGDETPELCLRLNEHAEIIKVFAGNYAINEGELKSYEPFVHYFLFDTRGKKYGGNGVSFDWEKLESLSLEKPIILSGGISFEHLNKIKTLDINLHAIDVNSKFEIAPGLKNIELLKQLKDNLT